jgi:dTDP-4-amino-4,6-dideoxygalactose transaminase
LNQWPHYGEDEIAAVVAVLRSGKVNAWTGDDVRAFEEAYARLVGRGHAIALANGTLALELALRALGIGQGDEVVVPSRTFVASATCVAMQGAVPVFADVDPDSQNLTAETIEAVLSPRTRGIIAVHLAGWPCEMEPILALAQERGLMVIEDCAQAHGALYRGRPVGSFGHAAAFSFCQDKIITTGGEGGMLIVDDDAAWRRAWSFKDHGKSYDSVHRRDHPPGFRWLHDLIGTNWRMTGIQAAIGRVQLGKLSDWTTQRTRTSQRLLAAFSELPALRTPEPPPEVRHAWYRLYTFVRPERLRSGWDRDRILDAVNAAGVRCFTGSCPEIYLERAFLGPHLAPERRLPLARQLGETSLAFLVDPTQDEDAVQRCCDVVRRVVAQATRPVGRSAVAIGRTSNR